LTGPGAHVRKPVSVSDAQDGRDGPPEKRPVLFRAAKYTAIGFEFPTTVGAGLVLGHYADSYFGSSPWMVLVLGLLGLVMAFWRLVMLLRHFAREHR